MHVIKKHPQPMSGLLLFILVMFFLLSLAFGLNIADDLSAHLAWLTGGP